MLRRILAAFVGLVVWTTIWLSGNAGIRAVWPGAFIEDVPTRDAVPLIVALVLSVIASLVAGYVAASIARGQAVKAAWMLALVNLAIGIFVQIGYWHVMPIWYHLIFLALLVPGVVIGGHLRAGNTSAIA